MTAKNRSVNKTRILRLKKEEDTIHLYNVSFVHGAVGSYHAVRLSDAEV